MTIDPQHAAWHDAVDTRDPAFDGVFLVAITSTRIYCRPVCPSRPARRENRRFFDTGAAAEAAGFRACKRCRPELARGETPLDVVPRRALAAASQIATGVLNGRSVHALAATLGVSDRHLRRTLGRAVGVSPFRLGLEQRLQTARDLLAGTQHTITRVAYDSGFQSVRRFNAAFRQQYRMSPSEWRERASRG